MATEPRRPGVLRGRRWVRALALAGASAVVFGPGGDRVLGQPRLLPAPAGKAAAPAPQPDPAGGKRVAAFVHGNIPVTREELGEFLISRGGMDKLDVLINKQIIEKAAADRGLTVTVAEIDAGLNDDLHGIGVKREEFVQLVLPKYGKTLYEWTEDVIQPRLLLGKLARPRVQVTAEDLRKAFETKYGEKREAQIIAWPKGVKDVPPLDQAVKDTAAANPAEFDKLAAHQPNKDLAKVGGRIAPIGRHIDGEDPDVEKALFSLQVGETRWVETQHQSTCIRLIRVVPPDAAVTFEQVRAALEKDVLDKKLNAEIPNLFAELKRQANPTLTVHVPLRPGTDPKAPEAVRAPVQDPRVLAVIFHNVPVTREQLGEFLIARGGYEKLDFLVNKKVIELEAARRGVTATAEEVAAWQAEYVKKLGVSLDDFVKHILPRQGLTPLAWAEDVAGPEIVLGKMCKDRVKVTDDDLRKAFENRYGEKRQAKVIVWGKDEFRAAQKQWDEARQGDVQFDRVARAQRDPTLASACGTVAPIGRHLEAENPLIEQVVFTLKVGEVSQLFETPVGIMCVKCVGTVPPTPGVSLDGVRAALEKEVYERKLAKEIPTFFAELRRQAAPNILLKGPPTDRDNREGVRNLVDVAGGPPPGVAPPMK